MPEIQRKLLWLISIRLLVASAIIVSYLLYDLGQWRNPQLHFFTGFVCCQTLVGIALLGILRNRTTFHAHLQLISDLVLVTLLLHSFQVAASFSTLYILVIAVAAIYLSRNEVLFIAGLAYLFYASVISGLAGFVISHRPIPELPNQPFEAFLLAYNYVMHLLAFYGVAILTSYLARDAARSAAKLRKTHLDLANLQSLHSDVIRSMSSGLMILDLDGHIVSINPSGQDILGDREQDLQGVRITDSGLFDEDQWRQQIEHTSSGQLRSEVRCRRSDGRSIDVGFTLTLLYDGEGRRQGYTLLFQDLTAWRALQEQVRIHDRMAALGQMAAGLAHEVGNPLAAISGSVEMMARSFGDETPQHRLLAITLKESRRLDRTVKAFLQFAKPHERRPERVDVVALLGGDLQLLSNSEDILPNHVIEKDLEPAIIYADRDQLGQIFWNLARNALRAMPEGGTFKLIGRQMDSGYEICFSDTGKGMTSEEKAALFHPFKSFFDRGLGLGMAIVYRVVEEHGGEIRVDSTPGEGSQIYVYLPNQPIHHRLQEAPIV